VEEDASRETFEESKGTDPEEGLENSDLPSAVISNADLLMDEVCGGHVHQNPGQHLHGDIDDDASWQKHLRCLVVYPAQTYNAPLGAVGRCFVEKLAELLEDVPSRKWNLERFYFTQWSYYNAHAM
jgi:hypothetical protein